MLSTDEFIYSISEWSLFIKIIFPNNVFNIYENSQYNSQIYFQNSWIIMNVSLFNHPELQCCRSKHHYSVILEIPNVCLERLTTLI